ncbi:MAG: epoxide hydrolase [Chloroflexi bacterium]|nr:epoxide hydrolase [Chloroflexota bacterium]
MDIQPFAIQIPQATLDDLQTRLAMTRWPDQLEGFAWEFGANLGYMKTLIDYWQNQYNWRAEEAKLNQFPQYLADIQGQRIHFIHARGKGPDPMPIILTHGWPSSFFEMLKLVPLLTDPNSSGGDPEDSFDVVIPSMPGYGFSSHPRERGGMSGCLAAGMWAKLMTDGLGYKRFAAAGSDFGAIITQYLTQDYPNLLTGIYLTYIGFYPMVPDQSELSEAEKRYLGAQQVWTFREGAYFMIQSTKPQTLSYALTDSPVGLAAWITEKFHSWTDSDGDLDQHISKDELLTNIMIYWLTQTIGSSIRSYVDQTPGKMEPLPPIPAAFASFPKDILPPPREWVARRVNLRHWTVMPRGGHFAALEEPQLMAEDMRKFFRQMREER